MIKTVTACASTKVPPLHPSNDHRLYNQSKLKIL